jgi:HlyD family secretion protein
MSKKTIYLLIGGAIGIIALLIILFKNGVKHRKEVETAVVNATTIVETVSAIGKYNPKLRLKFVYGFWRLFHYLLSKD